jgi:hypothetical protein
MVVNSSTKFGILYCERLVSSASHRVL